jgi:hypothetical protein
MDIYSERQLRDTRVDQQANRSMLQESFSYAMTNLTHGKSVNEGELRHMESGLRRLDNTERDQMAFASIAVCSPLMLLAMGSTFAFMDNMRQGLHTKFESALKNRFQPRGAASPVERVLRQNQRPLGVTNEAFRQADEENSLLKGRKKKLSLSSEGYRSVSMLSAPAKNWLKLNKLSKEKQLLSDHLEKMRGKLSLSSVSNLVSRIEGLDKELKKLGC